MRSLLSIKYRPVIVALVAFVYLLFSAFAIYSELYVFCIAPLALVLIYLTIYRLKWVLVFLLFATPLSLNLEDLNALGGIGIYLPTEPILFGLMLLYIVKLISGYRERRDLIKHPLSIAIIISLVWLAITAVTSTMPVVSFKFLLARLWFVLVMYFMINKFFKSEKFIRIFLWAYTIGLGIVICYAVSRHAIRGFAEDPAHWVMEPFYKDHTSYGALIALFLPVVFFHFYRQQLFSLKQFATFAVLAVFTAGFIFSFTRAAWVSLAGALVVFVLIKLKIDIKLLILAALLLAGGYLGFEDQIIHTLERNRTDSSGNIQEHVQSITNISSDASNLERLNRWSSALKMFYERPFFGYGPGTYQFTYAIFQQSADKTIISTNQGDVGNAHSEYLGPLSESGVFGALSILAVFIVSLYTGIRLYYRLESNSYLKGIVMSIILGLTTYYLHGIMNNYLDTDKASVPLWGMMSILVAIEIYHGKGGVNENTMKVMSKHKRS